MIGTTHFTNAIVEARRLAPTAAIRLGLPATRALPPMIDWPERLASALGRHVYLCHGGHEFDGRVISPIDRDEIRRVAKDVAAKGIASVAISSVFSPVNAEFEQEAAAIVRERCPMRRSASRTRSAAWGCWSARTRRSSTPACGRWRRTSPRRSRAPSPTRGSPRRCTCRRTTGR